MGAKEGDELFSKVTSILNFIWDITIKAGFWDVLPEDHVQQRKQGGAQKGKNTPNNRGKET